MIGSYLPGEENIEKIHGILKAGIEKGVHLSTFEQAYVEVANATWRACSLTGLLSENAALTNQHQRTED